MIPARRGEGSYAYAQYYKGLGEAEGRRNDAYVRIVGGGDARRRCAPVALRKRARRTPKQRLQKAKAMFTFVYKYI